MKKGNSGFENQTDKRAKAEMKMDWKLNIPVTKLQETLYK